MPAGRGVGAPAENRYHRAHALEPTCRPRNQRSLLPTDLDDLGELVDDAAKALSIGGTRQADGDMRQAVDRLKRQLAEEETPAE